ncbi:hypothetical protein CLAFUW4_09285 [Fulvia fulva]|uniref:Phosphatidate phosphatase APP1 catalytic domain-containing protein n=1 Tax=Passalora fulva TaxID=5499 RepID=A0A9Q8PFL3_PASFU|nr:uncharacterized protein CLAFUR5_09386 [Fulvia fulva]KAK4613910.1 hypothetical protein CLAFUR4_09291 [Fulvia fulva]KAK4614927.1 hypothetical protein CLAFUR0_09283 [Fulvia fulva]UJO21530.1 hypothetical protein CLAFUR5_09386 [Fulvia fulva]WPV20807.1 hypothetical protein CLAFUW4_09285 [Fulvia fulva]WPV34809.1 hypothetical protein CLAFUW7_09286 [Fulvia fulva]
MPALTMRSLLLPASLLSVLVSATPAPTARRAPDANALLPRETPTLVRRDVTKTYKNRRDIIGDIKSDVDGILGDLGNVPSYIASGVAPWFQGFPTGHAVASSLGVDDEQLAAAPTQALNIPPYANFTDQGWNVRFHGNIYKQPPTSNETLDKLAGDLFIYGTDFHDLPESQQAMARNVTAAIFVVQQGDVEVSTIEVAPYDGDQAATGGSQNITLPYNTTAQGDFDVFMPIQSNGLMNGNETQQLQKLNTWVTNTTNGNATAYLVPNEGLTIVSDIDDILRVTKIYDPQEGLLNSFARPFVAWENMPEIYANWSQALPNAHFHYLTTLPEQVTRNYEQFIYDTYPAGSFDTRPLNFSDVSATLSIRQYLLTKIFETFPQRKFVLVADTSNSDVMRDYPQMYHDYPNQVQCIFLRNSSATDDSDKFPYNTDGFKGIPQERYMFIVNADDLANINIAGESCYNQSVAQNLTFGYQGLPLGIGNDASVNGSANGEGNKSSAAYSLPANTGMTFFAFVSMLFWQLL